MIGLEGIFVGKSVQRMESMLNQSGMIINQKWSLRITGFYGTDRHFITASRPDMIFIDKEHHKCQITGFAILHDTRVDDKEIEKIEKYLDLARELKKVWNIKVTEVPLVVGVLGTPAKALEKR